MSPGADDVERVLASIDALEGVIESRRRSEALPDISQVLLELESATSEIRSGHRPAAAGPTLNVWRFEFRPSSGIAAKGITVNTVLEELRGIGQIMSATPIIVENGAIAFEFMVASNAPKEKFQTLLPLGVTYSATSTAAVSPAPEPQRQQVTPGAANVIRVEMNRLDELMRMVGELVINRSRLENAVHAEDLPALQDINLSMERQLRELREAVMRVRMVPVGLIFERMRFVVRGLERDLGKRIEVQLQGQDTEIDKHIVERMMDPVLHLVRNAVSHGLELPQERLAAGKPEAGFVRLKASTAGDTVLIEVEDDGRGIDVDGITKRARLLKLIGPEETVEEKRLLDIISGLGFTTRDKADLASGRGVGMAAVHAVVKELGGAIHVATEAGRGTRFSIRLPLTLLIADSLMVNVAGQRFAVPQAAVQEVLAVDTSQLQVAENNEMLSFRGGVLPILRLTKCFGLPDQGKQRMHLLVIGNGGGSVGLAVDRITGHREIVVRAINDPLCCSPGIIGATEVGDGRPVLIVDPHSLIREARG
jgi:two-component system chemotaxis sensor kinase CheA